MVKYELVSPVIGGTINTTFDEKNPGDAAKKLWETLTQDNKLFVNSLPKFMFTLKSDGGELSHFIVKEVPDENRNVSYTIDDISAEVNSKNTKAETKEFLAESARIKASLKGAGIKHGGKRDRYKKDDSSSSSSDDDDIGDYLTHIKKKSYQAPIYYWWYSPTYYKTNTLFMPTFIPSINPMVKLWIPMR